MPLPLSKVLYGVEEQLDSETPLEYENKNFKMETNNRIEIDNRIFAFTNIELEQFITEPIKEYLQGLVPMNFGNKKITSALNEDDFKCDMKTLKNDLIKYKSELKECLDFGIKGAGSNYLYADADPYDNYYYGSKYMDAIKYLYNTISLHPLEFVKAAREETYNVGIEDIPSEVDLEPVVKEINKETNKFYFVYPPFFYKMVEECGLKEYNPYEREKYEYGWGYYCVDGTSKSQTQIVNSNPGFAPLSINGKGVKAFDKLFANPNGLFREEYQGKKGPYGHEGLDFDGAIGTEIYSFINGVVEKIPKSQGALHYGMNLVIKSPNGYLYLLGHLSEICVQEKETIYPGKLVAKVGNTGNCKSSGGGDGSHLHLSVYKADKWKDIVSGLSGENYDNYKWSKDLINPFDYNQSYFD